MRLPLRLRLYNLWDVTLKGWLEQTWKCHIQGQHHVKMGSHPNCYRCGKKVA